jgi:GMP synthase-like glutamine amidotransferase
MRAHFLQHVPFEGLGAIEPWLKDAGYIISATKFFDSFHLPDLSDVDLLIVMGGPMSVNDEQQYPWLALEKEFVRQAITADIPVLGICLGAQIIAGALGAEIYSNHYKEIGWFQVEACMTNGDNLFTFPATIDVFHWHGETFDLPRGAVHLARSRGCEYQAFQFGKSVIGLQFHLETTPESAKDIIDHCRGELVDLKYVQSERTLLAAPAAQYRAINALLSDVLLFLTR